MLSIEEVLNEQRNGKILTFRAMESFPDHATGNVIKYSYTAACVVVALYYSE